MEQVLKDQVAGLEASLGRMGAVAVAFSGGVDSTLLLAVAQKVLGTKAVAINVHCEFVTRTETREAKQTAADIGVKLVSLETRILSNESVIQNTKDRCYACKKEMFGLISRHVKNMGKYVLVHGVNADDLKDFRPGLKAARELEFQHPLADAGLTKEQVRYLAREMGLANWNKPSQSCLATRIAYNETITPERLAIIEKAEAWLKVFGFKQVRVRSIGNSARVEVEPDKVAALLEEGFYQNVVETISGFGFDKVTIDREGYQTGKMNKDIKQPPEEMQS